MTRLRTVAFAALALACLAGLADPTLCPSQPHRRCRRVRHWSMP